MERKRGGQVLIEFALVSMFLCMGFLTACDVLFTILQAGEMEVGARSAAEQAQMLAASGSTITNATLRTIALDPVLINKSQATANITWTVASSHSPSAVVYCGWANPPSNGAYNVVYPNGGFDPNSIYIVYLSPTYQVAPQNGPSLYAQNFSATGFQLVNAQAGGLYFYTVVRMAVINSTGTLNSTPIYKCKVSISVPHSGFNWSGFFGNTMTISYTCMCPSPALTPPTD